MKSIPEIDALRQQAILSSLAGFPFLLVFGVVWIAAGTLSYVVPREIAPWIYVLLGMPATPIALAIEKRVGYVRVVDPDPLLPLILQIFFVQIVAFPAILLVWDLAPYYVPVAFAAVVGAHFLPFQWVYRTRVYGVLGVVVAVGPYVLAVFFREDAMHYTGFFVGGTLLIGAFIARSHARATWVTSKVLVVLLAMTTLAGVAFAHPGAAIAVAPDGRVFFVDTGGGVFSIERDGRVVRREGPAFHWFAFDSASRFASTRWPSIPDSEIRAAGVNPTVVLSSDFPVAIGTDGAFYYPQGSDGRVRIHRIAPSGERSVRATVPAVRRGGQVVTWLNGLAAGPDNSLYYTEDRAIRIVDARGGVATLVDAVNDPSCVPIPGIEKDARPYLRGLAVTPDGTVYVAASGCGSVLKISPRGQISAILRTSSPWSPTAVAAERGEVYVLEYLHTASDNRREWIPRVRKISSSGAVVTLANTKPR